MKVDYRELLAETCEQLRNGGAFLVTANNAMTIGWAQFGVVWSKPVCTVLVRQSRFTHDLLKTNDRISVCVPKAGTFKEELAYCGTRSGRDEDKCKACGMTLLPSEEETGAAHVAGCPIWFEAHIVAVTELPTEEILDESIIGRHYGPNRGRPDGDPHTLYFCQIDAAYREEV